MDISESFRVGEEIAKTSDIFDFVVNSSADSVSTEGCRSLKSLGIYLESTSMENNNNAVVSNEQLSVVGNDDNNNNTTTSCNTDDLLAEKSGALDKEQNNNHLLVTNGSSLAQCLEESSGYWTTGATAKDQIRWDQSMLEELGCWNHENGNPLVPGTGPVTDEQTGDNTDGAIYTLTVLNGTGDTWYRLADSDRTPAIDIDSLLNNLLPNNGNQVTPPATCFQVPYPQLPAGPDTERATTQDTNARPSSPTPKLEPANQFIFQETFLETTSTPTITTPPYNPLKSNQISTTDSICNNLDSVEEEKNNINNNNSRNKNNNSNCSNSRNNSNKSKGNCSGNINDNNSNSSNNSEWKYLTTDTNESDALASVNSLLRNALQGKSGSFTSRYNGSSTTVRSQHDQATSRQVVENTGPLVMAPCVALEGVVVPVESSAPAHHMDDIFLSQLDVVGYGEDYDKLKSIEHEVATSVEQYCAADPAYFTESGSIVVHPATLASCSATKSNTKKYSSKRSSSSSSGAHKSDATTSCSPHHRPPVHGHSPSGGRKERSLHYCAICHKGFKDKYSVNVHVRTHTGEKPFTCAFCGKHFRQKAHLAKHHHTHSAQKSTSAPTSSGKPHTHTSTHNSKQQP